MTGAATATGGAARIQGWQAWMLFLLTLSMVLAFADRGLMGILTDPIRADLGISDFQASLLLGTAFSVVYSLTALPIGGLVDAVDRRRLVAAAVIVWSVITILCGLAHSFGQLFVGRMGLGMAEAAVGPAAFSLIRNAFPPSQRGRAFALFNSSHLIGLGSSLFVGGSLYGLALDHTFDAVPFVGGLRSWQQVMAILGFVGLPIGALILTMREPAREEVHSDAPRSSFRDVLVYVKEHRSTLLPFWAGLAFFTMAQGGAGWASMVIHRTWDIPIPVVGKALGPIAMAVGFFGSLIMGTVMDMLARRGRQDAPILVCMCALSVSAVLMLLQLFITDLAPAAVIYVLQILFFAAHAVAASAGLALMAPARLAGKLQAISGIATNLIGLASGPTIVALAGEHLFSGPRALHDAMASVVVIAILLGVFMYALVRRGLKRQGIVD